MIVSVENSRKQEAPLLAGAPWLTRTALRWLVVAGFSVFYFADVCLRASSKLFWYDEILTLYFSRIPTISGLWGALGTGIESNPPAFHLLTRGVEKVFGEGLIATRLPEIVSFWVLCLCLFKYVSRRAGTAAGFIAMALPMLTGAYFYAYEARPLIMVVAMCAVALTFWDHAIEEPGKTKWLVGFSISLFAAFMLHCYAILLLIPFGAAEVYRSVRAARIDKGIYAAMILPLIPACALYLPLMRVFNAVSKGTDFVQVFPPLWPRVAIFYSFLLEPCLVIVLAAFCLLAMKQARGSSRSEPGEIAIAWFRAEDAVLCLGFLALPALGVMLAQLVNSPYFGRYFLSALVGICVPFAITTTAGRSRSWVAVTLVTLICCGLTVNFARLIRHRLTGTGEALIEPSSQFDLNTTPKKPLEKHPLIASIPSNSLPIVVLEPTEFLFFVHYAPALAKRLYYVRATSNDMSLRAFRDFRRWSPVPYNSVEFTRDFVSQHPDFYVYGAHKQIEELGRWGRFSRMKSYKGIEDHYLAEMISGH